MNNLYGMNLNEYQSKALETAVYPGAREHGMEGVVYTTLGLAGEAGEIANKVKKVLRDAGGKLTEDMRTELAKELGDVLWYVATLAEELDADLSAIAELNLEKLTKRHESGTIWGSGDNR